MYSQTSGYFLGFLKSDAVSDGLFLYPASNAHWLRVFLPLSHTYNSANFFCFWVKAGGLPFFRGVIECIITFLYQINGYLAK